LNTVLAHELLRQAALILAAGHSKGADARDAAGLAMQRPPPRAPWKMVADLGRRLELVGRPRRLRRSRNAQRRA
jgi:hypothetical protein